MGDKQGEDQNSMEIGGRRLPFQSVTAKEHISIQTTDWKRKARKGNNMSKKILTASGVVKEEGQGHRKLPTLMAKSISLKTAQACHNMKVIYQELSRP